MFPLPQSLCSLLFPLVGRGFSWIDGVLKISFVFSFVLHDEMKHEHKTHG